MRRKRKTKDELAAERAEKDRRQWELFRPQLEAVATYMEGLRLAHEGPGPDQPGRTFRSNLAFFLSSFVPPMGSSHEEKRLYINLIKRLDAGGELKEGVAAKTEQALLQAMKSQGPWG